MFVLFSSLHLPPLVSLFFFNDTATTEIYTLSLHDALPISLMYVLNFSAWTHILCGNYAAANALVDEFSGLKDQTGSLFWGAWGMMQRGCLTRLLIERKSTRLNFSHT